MFLHPRKPETVTPAEAYALSPDGQGIRYFFANDESEEEMTYSTLSYCVRNDPEYGFADDDTIAEASSHSDAELWSDVIVPAILDGRIERAVWGVITTITDTPGALCDVCGTKPATRWLGPDVHACTDCS